MRCEYHAVEEVQWLTGEGLLTPQQCVFRLTARPGAFDLNRKQAALQRLRYGCCHAGLSDKIRKSLPFYRLRNNFVVAKKPLPLEPHINKGINDALHEVRQLVMFAGNSHYILHW